MISEHLEFMNDLRATPAKEWTKQQKRYLFDYCHQNSHKLLDEVAKELNVDFDDLLELRKSVEYRNMWLEAIGEEEEEE